MPWSPKDADKFKKGLSHGSKIKWAKTANSVLKKTGNEGQAIKIANSVTRTAILRRMKKKAKGFASG